MWLLEVMFLLFIEMMSIGKLFEGRDIYVFCVGVCSEEEEEGGLRKIIFVIGGFYGCEWILISMVIYLMWFMVIVYDKDLMVIKLFDKFDIIFIFILNFDGYEYIW